MTSPSLRGIQQQVAGLAIDHTLVQVPLTFVDSLLLEVLSSPEDVREAAAQCLAETGRAQSYSGFLLWASAEVRARRAGADPPAVKTPIVSVLLRLTNADEHLDADVIYRVANDVVTTEVIQAIDSLPDVALVPKDLRWLYRPLKSMKSWMVTTQRALYEGIAKYQTDFLKSWEPFRLKPLPISDVGNVLGLPHHASTYSRLTAHRRVRLIDGRNRQVLLDVRLLMPNLDDLLRSRMSYRINEMLTEELRTAVAQSDSTLAEALGFARRTIAKYREEARIPPAQTRQKMYLEGVCTLPFQVPMPVHQQLGVTPDAELLHSDPADVVETLVARNAAKRTRESPLQWASKPSPGHVKEPSPKRREVAASRGREQSLKERLGSRPWERPE